MFNKVYSELVRGWDINIEFAVSFILKELKKQRFLEPAKEKIVFLDNHYLENYEEPRDIIELLGAELVEMRNNRKETYCFPSEASFKETFPNFSEKIKEFILKNTPENIDKIVSCSPSDFCYLKSFSSKAEEISELILRRINNATV